VSILFNVQGTLLTEVRGSRTTRVVAWCRCSFLGWRKALWNFHLYPLTRALLAYWRGLYVLYQLLTTCRCLRLLLPITLLPFLGTLETSWAVGQNGPKGVVRLHLRIL
jgi:hypothetical protein